jgi:hypothetical protein
VNSLQSTSRRGAPLIGLAGIGAILAVAVATALISASPAQAAPYWCKAWQVSGQTWYADQGGFTLMFNLRTPPGSTRFGGSARYSRGDVNLGGTPSQLLTGAVSSENAGRILMNITWRNGPSGQYIATVTDVRRTPSGNLTAGLRGTTVDTTPGARNKSASYWHALGGSSGLGTSGGRYVWPMFCARESVLRYPA